MDIVCKNCNTSYYIRDDKIPLENRTVKCKQCNSPITLLGKNALNATDLFSNQPTSTEQEATKNCDFCGEKILAIAKKCRHCGSLLDGNIFSQNVEQNTPPPIGQNSGIENWFYDKNGQQQSVTKVELIELIKSQKITRGISVWKQGFSDWTNIENTELKIYFEKPSISAFTEQDVSNTFAWLLAFTPLIGAFLEGFVIGLFGGVNHNTSKGSIATLMIITMALHIWIACVDEKRLRQYGHNTDEVRRFTWLAPVYLYKRAEIFNQNLSYFSIWIFFFWLKIQYYEFM